ncbi:hypothetical protein VNO80_14461 [Phaseolus coccineus]|uniref:Glycosyltransferase N-terminal domain-containing protein n=1 Tax=Phaseolus coccineus TaxID=3886 RepID=A0AAN9MIS1_PHACN
MAFNGDNLPHQNQVVVVLIPFPAQGHLNQFMHLSHLISSHDIPVHYVSTVTHIRQATLRHHKSIISNLNFHGFEVPPFVSPPPNPNNPETDFPSHLIPSFEASTHLQEPVGKLLQSISSQAKRVIVIHDSLMASVAQDATNMPNVENYTFHCTSAFATFAFFWEEMGKPPLKAFRVPEFPLLEGCFPTQFIDFIVAQYELQKFNDGNIYNTSRVVEDPYLELLDLFSAGKKVWALGPFNPLTVEKKDSIGFRHSCMEWLDKQEPKVLKVGLVVKDWDQRDALVTASDVEKAVRRLMETKEGDEIRERAVGLKNVIHRSMDEGGVSHMEMGSFIAQITK